MKKRIKQYINNYNSTDMPLTSSCGFGYSSSTSNAAEVGHFYVINASTPIDITDSNNSNMLDYYYHTFTVSSSISVPISNSIFTCNIDSSQNYNNPNGNPNGKIFGVVSTNNNTVSAISYSEDYVSLYNFATLYNKVTSAADSVGSQNSKNYSNTIQEDVPKKEE